MEDNRCNDNNNDMQMQSQPSIEKPMTWHNYLIYFSLWVSSLSCVSNALMMFNGSHYGSKAEAANIYSIFDGLKTVDTISAVLSLCIAVFTIVTRFSLAKRQEKGPKLLLASYAISAADSLFYLLMLSNVLSVPFGQLIDGSTLGTIIGSVIFFFVNRVYYRKRAHLFVY